MELNTIFKKLSVPEDSRDALKLRLNAYTFAVERYTGHFDSVEGRVPDLVETSDRSSWSR